jgi:hypothetical protein
MPDQTRNTLSERLLDGWLGKNAWVREAWVAWLSMRNERGGNRPTEVESGCWIGGVPSRRYWRELEAAGVTHVVSLVGEAPPPAWLAAAAVLWLPVRDRAGPTWAQLRAGVDFLDAARASSRRVFVFCGTGSGRAPTLYAAWLVARDGGTPAAAVKALHERRPRTAPTLRQMAALESWASELATRPG